jgi:hypothetical protein
LDFTDDHLHGEVPFPDWVDKGVDQKFKRKSFEAVVLENADDQSVFVFIIFFFVDEAKSTEKDLGELNGELDGELTSPERERSTQKGRD